MAELNRVVLQELLQKEAEGTLTPHEQQMLEEWHHTFDVPERAQEVFRDSQHEQLVKFRLFNRILKSGYTEKENIPPKKTIRFHPSFRWTAAAIFLLVLGYGTLQLKKSKVPQSSYAGIKKASSHPLPKGVKRIVLADGSTVILNKDSHLDYPETFGSNTREVYLRGEAYFDIQHDEKKPFLVHTGKLTTRVLGTAFNIKAKVNENDVEVTVSRGKVAVSDQQKTLAVLLPDQKISYHVNSSTAEKSSSNAKIATLWKEEDLVLNDIAMDQAINLLEERYGAEINLASDQISHCKFTAYFLNTTSLRQVLSVISKLNNLSYTQTKNGVYILSGDGCEIKK